MANRRIIGSELHAAGKAAPSMDSYFDRVLKYIPADIVGAWVAVLGILNGINDDSRIVRWVVFLVLLVLTPLWTMKMTSIPGRKPAMTQMALSTISFCVWVIAIGGNALVLGAWYKTYYGSLLLILYTVAVGLVTPKE